MRLLVAALLLIAPADAAAAAWSPPVEGPVTRAFDLGPDPFEAGRHRGIDLAAPRGTSVRAPCAGRVAVAGTVGTNGGMVTIRCGRWRVSHMPLATIAVRPGDTTRPGALLGTLAGSTAHAGLHLGVRRHGTRFGYVDPARFFDTADLPPPPVPGARTDRRPRLGPAPRPALVARPALVRRPVLAPAPRPALVARPADAVVPPALVAAPAAVVRPAAGVVPPALVAAPGAVVRPAARVVPPALVAGPHVPGPGSRPAGRGGVAPWAAWAGLALALAGLGFRGRRHPRERRAPRPFALPREVR